VVTKSSEKAVVAIERYFENDRCFEIYFEWLASQNSSDPTIQSIVEATMVIKEMNDLTEEQSERLLRVLCSLAEGERSLHLLSLQPVLSLCEVFGCVCCNPKKCISTVIDHCEPPVSALVLVALSKRCEVTEDMSEYAEDLCHWARSFLQHAIQETPAIFEECAALRLLGCFGTSTDQDHFDQDLVERFQQVRQNERETSLEAASAAALLQQRRE